MHQAIKTSKTPGPPQSQHCMLAMSNQELGQGAAFTCDASPTASAAGGHTGCATHSTHQSWFCLSFIASSILGLSPVSQQSLSTALRLMSKYNSTSHTSLSNYRPDRDNRYYNLHASKTVGDSSKRQSRRVKLLTLPWHCRPGASKG